jgi:hypothetical protein
VLAFLDMYELERRAGPAGARSALRDAVMGQLHRGRA